MRNSRSPFSPADSCRDRNWIRWLAGACHSNGFASPSSRSSHAQRQEPVRRGGLCLKNDFLVLKRDRARSRAGQSALACQQMPTIWDRETKISGACELVKDRVASSLVL